MKFFRSAIASFLALTLIGCPAQNTIASLIAILGNSTATIAALEGNDALAQKLRTDTAAAVVAVTNWKSGTPAQEAIQALNLVEDDLNLLPMLGPYGPLIDLAIGTTEAILALLPQSVTAPAARTASPRRAVHLNQSAPKSARQYKAQFNAIVASNPALSAAKIK